MAERLISEGSRLVRMPVHTKSPAGILSNAARLARLIGRNGSAPASTITSAAMAIAQFNDGSRMYSRATRPSGRK